MSRTTAPYVSGASVGLPGNMWNPVTPYASTGSTGTPRGSAASRARRSAMMLSVSSERYACCSVEPSGSTTRSSRPRYSSSCIQLRSRILMTVGFSRALERGVAAALQLEPAQQRIPGDAVDRADEQLGTEEAANVTQAAARREPARRLDRVDRKSV